MNKNLTLKIKGIFLGCAAFVIDCIILFTSKLIIYPLTFLVLTTFGITSWWLRDAPEINEEMVAALEINIACAVWFFCVVIYFIFMPLSKWRSTAGAKVANLITKKNK